MALASTGAISHQLPVDAVLKGILAGALAAAARRRRRLPAGDPDHRRASRSAPTSRSSCRPGAVRLSAQCKGAGMISPRFATMLCFVQTDAALRAARRPTCCSGVCVKRSFDRCSVDGQLSTNDTAILMCSGRQRRRGRRRERGRAALRRGARRAAAPARDHDGRPTARAPRASRACSSAAEITGARRGGGPRGRQLAAGQDRAARRRPQLGPDRPGGRRRPAGRRAAGVRRLDRGHRRSARPAPRSPTTRPRWRGRCSARRSSTRSGCPGEGAETEVFFSDLSHEYVAINADYTT